jgi:hypothetical protein
MNPPACKGCYVCYTDWDLDFAASGLLGPIGFYTLFTPGSATLAERSCEIPCPVDRAVCVV